jgi:hypothetical protein
MKRHAFTLMELLAAKQDRYFHSASMLPLNILA